MKHTLNILNTLFAFTFALLGCAAEDLTPPSGDEPVAGSVAVSAQALTQTVTLTFVMTHFGLSTSPTFTTLPYNGQVYVKYNPNKTLFTKVGDTAIIELKHGYWSGAATNIAIDSALDQLCVDLSNRKVYLKINGALAQGLNLEGKLVVR